MKSKDGLLFAAVALCCAMLSVNCFYVWHMAGLYDRLHKLEGLPASKGCSRNEFREHKEPTQKEVADYIESHNGSTPPDSWYPNGNPWRNFTAEEANKMLEGMEDK